MKIVFPTKSAAFLISAEGHLLCEVIGSSSTAFDFEGMVKQELNDSFATLKNHMDQFYQKCTPNPLIFSCSCRAWSYQRNGWFIRPWDDDEDAITK